MAYQLGQDGMDWLQKAGLIVPPKCSYVIINIGTESIGITAIGQGQTRTLFAGPAFYDELEKLGLVPTDPAVASCIISIPIDGVVEREVVSFFDLLKVDAVAFGKLIGSLPNAEINRDQKLSGPRESDG